MSDITPTHHGDDDDDIDEALIGEIVQDGEEGANPFAGIDFNSLMQQAQSLQSQLVNAQQAAAAQIVEGRAGGGQVTVTMTGEGEPLAVHVNPSVIDPEERELLEDLLLAAFKDAVAQAQELSRSALGGLGDLLGGSA